MSNATTNPYDISTGRMWLLALPCLPLGLMQGPVSGILGSIYVSHFGMSLAVVGTITLIARLFDAVTDPMIGYWSDRSKSRWGKRKPFILVGAVMTCVAIFFLYIPPTKPTTAYFLGWFLLLYLGWTLTDIPLAAWAVEVTSSAKERARIFMYRWIATSGGWILMFVIPYLPIFSSREITPETLRWVGIVSLVMFPVFVLFALRSVPQGRNLAVIEQGELWPFLRSAFRNGAFRIYLTTALLSGMSTGIYFSLSFLYFTQVLGYGEGYAMLGLITSVVAIPAYYLWVRVGDRIGSHRMCSVSAIGISATMLSLAFIPPGQDHFPLALVLVSISQIFASGWWVGTGPLLADASDYDLLKTGVNQTGKYFAFQAFVNKASNGAGGAIGFIMLGLLGYDATVGAANSEEAVLGIKWATIGIPTIVSFLAGVIVLWFPITPKRHAIIRRRLESRAERAERINTPPARAGGAMRGAST